MIKPSTKSMSNASHPTSPHAMRSFEVGDASPARTVGNYLPVDCVFMRVIRLLPRTVHKTSPSPQAPGATSFASGNLSDSEAINAAFAGLASPKLPSAGKLSNGAVAWLLVSRSTRN